MAPILLTHVIMKPDAACQIDTDGDGVGDNADMTSHRQSIRMETESMTLPSSHRPESGSPNSGGIDCVDGIHIPTGFSPNGDGNNDVYTIIVGKNVLSFSFALYDRWGNQMFIANEKGFEWDGTLMALL